MFVEIMLLCHSVLCSGEHITKHREARRPRSSMMRSASSRSAGWTDFRPNTMLEAPFRKLCLDTNHNTQEIWDARARPRRTAAAPLSAGPAV